MKILESGAWSGPIKHYKDDKLISAMVSLFLDHSISSVFDFGCGNGYYTKQINTSGIQCLGYDGNPDVVENSSGLCKKLDLSVVIAENMKADCVMCLEVAEHIPKKYEKNLIYNLKKSANKMIIISWAIPGQGGVGHVNEQNNDYVDMIMKPDFVRSAEKERRLRSSCTLRWFRKSLMVFDLST